jgi:hypothetical protein
VDVLLISLHRRRRVLVGGVVLALLLSLLPFLPAPAVASSGVESSFISAINRERAAAGLPDVVVTSDLTAAARRHSGVMAGASDLHHNPDLGGSVGGWRKIGENVGRGPSVDAIHNAFMASPGHRDNILDPDWTQVGVGVVEAGNTIWVTEMFRDPLAAEPTPSATPDAETSADDETTSAPTATAGGASAPTDSASDPSVPTPDPVASEQEPAAPTPHEVRDQPLALDRTTLLLARQTAAEQGMSLEAVLTDLLG